MKFYLSGVDAELNIWELAGAVLGGVAVVVLPIAFKFLLLALMGV